MGAVNEEPPRQRQRQQQLNFLVHEQANDAAGLAQRVAELEHELRLKGTALAASESACKRLESENGTLLAQTTEQRARIEALVAQLDATTPVTYELLHTDAQWAKHVGLFTWFKSVESNDAFLAAINLKHGADDPGICTRLRLYAKTMAPATITRSAMEQAMVDAVEESLSNVTRTSGVATASADDSAPARCQPSRASKRHRGAQAANNAQ